MHSGLAHGCELSYLSDIFWNQNSILGDDQRFGYENATAVAYALKNLRTLLGKINPGQKAPEM